MQVESQLTHHKVLAMWLLQLPYSFRGFSSYWIFLWISRESESVSKKSASAVYAIMGECLESRGSLLKGSGTLLQASTDSASSRSRSQNLGCKNMPFP